MKYPEKGTVVKVKWFDAFSYSSSKESEIEKSCINTSTGEWFGMYDVEKYGKTIEYVDIRYEKSNGGTHDGLRIPSGWIITIEEYELKNILREHYMSDTATYIPPDYKWEWKQNCN